jgi:hypothetical protein
MPIHVFQNEFLLIDTVKVYAVCSQSPLGVLKNCGAQTNSASNMLHVYFNLILIQLLDIFTVCNWVVFSTFRKYISLLPLGCV